MPRRRRIVVAAATVLLVLAAAAFAVTTSGRASSGGPATQTPASNDLPQRAPAIELPAATPPASGDSVGGEVDALARSTLPREATSAAYPPITGDATEQPDLYAEAFVQRLLTRDYSTPREQLLSWVQSETTPTTEPTIVGLIPADLRERWPVYSLTSMQPPVIPATAEWAAFADRHGRTSCVVQRVIQPPPWADAVSDGSVTDPGVTAREVSVILTTTTTDSRGAHTAVDSGALTIYLEGPPVRSSWGFAGAVLYATVQVSRS